MREVGESWGAADEQGVVKERGQVDRSKKQLPMYI